MAEIIVCSSRTCINRPPVDYFVHRLTDYLPTRRLNVLYSSHSLVRYPRRWLVTEKIAVLPRWCVLDIPVGRPFFSEAHRLRLEVLLPIYQPSYFFHSSFLHSPFSTSPYPSPPPHPPPTYLDNAIGIARPPCRPLLPTNTPDRPLDHSTSSSRYHS